MNTILAAIENQFAELTEVVQKKKNLSEILVFADGRVVVEVAGRLRETGLRFSEEKRWAQIKTLAGINNMVVNGENPRLSIKLPIWHGGRFHALVPPVVEAPFYAIRIPP